MAALTFPQSQWPSRIEDERAATMARAWFSAEENETRSPFGKGLLASPGCALQVYHTAPNIIVISFVVQPHLTNMGGAMHGGVYPLLIDELTSFVIVAKDKDSVKFGVSVHISTEFIGPAQLGDRIYIEASLDKGQVIATGRHTKFMNANDFTGNPNAPGSVPSQKAKL